MPFLPIFGAAPVVANAAGSRGPSGYLHRRISAAARYALTVLSPMDLGDTSSASPELPDRAPAARRAGRAAYQADLFTTPLDTGIVQPLVKPVVPSRAPAANRTDNSAYSIIVTAPADLGRQPTIEAITPSSAPSANRTAWLAYTITVSSPRDPGVVPTRVSSPTRSPGPRMPQISGYMFTVSAPPDLGTLCTSIYIPLRALASRQPLANYVATTVPSPADQGQLGYVGPRGNRARGAYLFQRLPQVSCYTFTVGPPIDLGIDEIWVAEVYPDRAPAARRAGQAAYQTGLFTSPHIADTLPVSIYLPARAPSPRVPIANYAQSVSSPHDTGFAQSIVEAVTPDRSPGAFRAAGTAYTITLPALLDAGVLPAVPAIATSAPDLARPAMRASASAYAPLTAAMPQDQGLAQSVVETAMPPQASSMRRAAQVAYAVFVPALADAGVLPTKVLLPSRSPKTRLAGSEAYQVYLVTPPPIDTSIALAKMPDNAMGPRLPMASYAITSPPPHDAGTEATSVYLPDQAQGPRFAANPAYLVLTVNTPLDEGLGQSLIPSVYPDFARGPQWAAQSSYVALVSPPPLTQGDLEIFPDPFGSVEIASTDPFDAADPFASQLLPTTDFAGADAQKGEVS